ncbi:MAG: hypothetical protein GY847_39735 [Proteobacteria bacterium]|nr:hypothetical protein [Pseudomonadota bacterium]
MNNLEQERFPVFSSKKTLLSSIQDTKKSMLFVTTGIGGLFVFLAHYLQILAVSSGNWAQWAFSSLLGLVIGAFYFFVVRVVVSREPQDPVFMSEMSVFHAPLSMLAFYPLDLHFVQFKGWLPPLNQSLFEIFAITYVAIVIPRVFDQRGMKYVKMLLRYFFLGAIAVLLIRELNFSAIATLINVLYKNLNIYVMSTLGVVTLIYHRDQIESVLQFEADLIKDREAKKKTFYEDHPIIARLYVLRRAIRFFYSEGLVVSLLFIVFMSLGCFSIFYRLGNADFGNDEFHQAAAAKGLIETGNYREWKWEKSDQWNLNPEAKKRNYTRSWPHTLLIAASFYLFDVNEWSARLPSALMGVLFLFLLYIFTKKLWENRWLSLIAIAVIALNYNTLFFFRLTRMYAPLAVLTLVCFYFLVRWLVENNTYNTGIASLDRFIEKHVNFNWGALIVSLTFFALGFVIHINTAILLPFTLFFAVWLFMINGRRREAVLLLVGLLMTMAVVVVAMKTDLLRGFEPHVTPFTKKNYAYYRYFVGYPAGVKFSFGFSVICVAIALVHRHGRRRHFFAALVLVSLTTVVFFAEVADRWQNIKYVSHIVPIFITCTVGAFGVMLSIYPKVVRVILVMLLLAGIGYRFESLSDKLYGESHPYGRMSKACEVIKREYKPETQTIIMYLPGTYTYYLQGISPDARIRSFRSLLREKRGFAKALTDIEEGWFLMPGYKKSRMRHSLGKYVRKHFKNRSLKGSKTYLYYFDRSMFPRRVRDAVGGKTATVKTTKKKEKRDGFTGSFSTGLVQDLAKPFSLVFWVKVRNARKGPPISLGHYKSQGISVEYRGKYTPGGFRFRYASSGNVHLKTGPLDDGRWHHIALYQTNGDVGGRFGLYVDGKSKGKRTISHARTKKVALAVRKFAGVLSDFRIYDFPLSKSQIKAIFNNGSGTTETQLVVEDSKFSPVQHWNLEK